MNLSIEKLGSFCAFTLCSAFGGYLHGQTTTPAAISLSPGDNIQAAVTAAPPGSTFVLFAGTYRMQSVVPQDNDIFQGAGTVDLNGSQVLNFTADPAVSGMYTSAATSGAMATNVTCDPGYPMCAYAQDLFIDSVLQKPATALVGLQVGSWYFDRPNGIVYLPTDPTGHTVELGMTTQAFSGRANGVQISNMVIEKYATPGHNATVGGYHVGIDWIADNLEVRWNHGTGVTFATNGQILNSFIHHNGQMGISLNESAEAGTMAMVSNSEIAWNNYAHFTAGWEGGGSKFWTTNNLTLRYNYVHDNFGPGLWADTNNVGTIYDSNTVTNNYQDGIKHEVSYAAEISNNVVKGNGKDLRNWLLESQITIQNSQNVQVYGNDVEVPATTGNGIGVINQDRGEGTLGPWVAINDSVHNNTISYPGAALKAASGLVDDTGNKTAVGDIFDYNTYIRSNCSKVQGWGWIGWVTWSGFQAAGQEAHGTCQEPGN